MPSLVSIILRYCEIKTLSNFKQKWKDFIKGSGSGSENESHSVMSNSLPPYGLYSPWNSPGQNTGVGSFSLLQGISPTQGSNPGLLHCRLILYQLRQGKPKNSGVGSLSLLQGIFPTQESNQGLLHCRQILCCLSHKGSPRILEWVAYPFSRGFS